MGGKSPDDRRPPGRFAGHSLARTWLSLARLLASRASLHFARQTIVKLKSKRMLKRGSTLNNGSTGSASQGVEPLEAWSVRGDLSRSRDVRALAPVPLI